jgi:hypothetical protein
VLWKMYTSLYLSCCSCYANIVQSVFLIDLPEKDGSTSDCSTSFYKDLVYFLKASTLHENIIRKLEDFDFSKTSQFAFVHTMYVSLAKYGSLLIFLVVARTGKIHGRKPVTAV